MSNLIIFDDRDLSQITYNGSWVQAGTPNDYEGTVTGSTTVGDTFVVKFSGTSIAVYGTLDPSTAGVQSSYALDGGAPVVMTAKAGLEFANQYNQPLWFSPVVKDGEHQLLVTMIKVNPPSDQGQGTVWFDYIVSTDVRNVSNPINVRRADFHAIIGGMVGSAGFLLIFASLFFYLRRQRNLRKSQHAPYRHWEKDDLRPPRPPFRARHGEPRRSSGSSRSMGKQPMPGERPTYDTVIPSSRPVYGQYQHNNGSNTTITPRTSSTPESISSEELTGNLPSEGITSQDMASSSRPTSLVPSTIQITRDSKSTNRSSRTLSIQRPSAESNSLEDEFVQGSSSSGTRPSSMTVSIRQSRDSRRSHRSSRPQSMAGPSSYSGQTYFSQPRSAATSQAGGSNSHRPSSGIMEVERTKDDDSHSVEVIITPPEPAYGLVSHV